MKTNIVYLFAGLLAVTLLSCSEDSEPLIMQEEVSTPMLDYQTLADAQRALRPSATAQEAELGQPDKKGEKGRDHRDWFDAFENTRIKNFEKDITQLEIGDLYAIDPDGVNPYIFKFYFPEKYRDYAKEEYEGMYLRVSLYSYWGQMVEYNFFSTSDFSLDDSFTVPRKYVSDWYYFECHYNYYSSWLDIREVKINDLVIIKEWH
ncbi:MAG: hypothetical protein J6T82_09200 [Bacteroidaceae bacterium]|nr:hypothetical protein [Bacteroidaceae bacterium]